MSDSITGEFKLSPALDLRQYSELRRYCEADHRNNYSAPDYSCAWDVSENGMRLVANEGEDHRDAPEWLQHLIDVFFDRWGVAVTGTVDLEGDWGDYRITAVENKVLVAKGWIEYGPFEPLGKETA